MEGTTSKYSLNSSQLLPRRFFNRAFALIYSFAILTLFYHHTKTLIHSPINLQTFFISLPILVSDLILTFTWLNSQCFRMNPVIKTPFPENLAKVFTTEEFPALDIFICTADPYKEPPMTVAATALSVMAYDYPAEKLSIYVSDDGGSQLTLFALMEAARFAKAWLPFCKENKIMERSPDAFLAKTCASHSDTRNIQVGFPSSMESSFENLSLSTEEEEELIFDSSEIQNPNQNPEYCLVGRFLTDRSINFNIMRNRMAEIWRPVRGMAVKEIRTNIFLFQFFHSMDLSRIMDGGPWTFDNLLLVYHRLNPGEVPTSVPLFSVYFWIQVHDLPMGFMSQSVGKQLGDFIGRFIEYDDKNNSSFWRSYMRIRVDLDVRKPLKRFKKIKKVGGELSTVHFKYEKLNTFCFYCGILGHSDKFCELLFETSNSNPTKEWGTWLRAIPRRLAATGGERWLRDDKDGTGKSTGISDERADTWDEDRDHRRDHGIPKDLIPHKSGNQVVGANSNYVLDNKENNASEIEGYQPDEIRELTMHDDKKRRRDGLSSEAQNKALGLVPTPSTQEETDKQLHYPLLPTDHFLTAGLEHQARRER